MEQPTRSAIDDALVECLRIFARRGRQLREERERQAGSEYQEGPRNGVDETRAQTLAQLQETASDMTLVEGGISDAAHADDRLTLKGNPSVANRG